jgi:hypothetical protein
MDVFSALFGGSDVCVDGNSHADVSCNDGSDSSNEEGTGGVELSKYWLNSEG